VRQRHEQVSRAADRLRIAAGRDVVVGVAEGGGEALVVEPGDGDRGDAPQARAAASPVWGERKGRAAIPEDASASQIEISVRSAGVLTTAPSLTAYEGEP